MRRRLFNLAALVSLLVGIAVAGLWVRGLWVNDIVGRYTPSGSWDIQAWHGILMLHISNHPGDSPPARTSWWPRPVTSSDTDSSAFQKRWWNRVGFGHRLQSYPTRKNDDWVGRTPRPAIQHHRYLRVPLWFIALLSAILPAIWARRWCRERQRFRLAHNLCLFCAYDLRGSPGPSCPECGAPIPTLSALKIEAKR